MKCYHYEGTLQYNFTIVPLRSLMHTVSFLIEGEAPLPDQLPE